MLTLQQIDQVAVEMINPFLDSLKAVIEWLNSYPILS